MRISKTIQYFAALFLALMAIGLVMHKTGYTFQVVDQIYCRGHLPWSVEYSVGPCVDRSGDDLFENDFIETELQYLSDNPHQQTYSERVMNGYPMKSAYSADTFTFFHLLSRFLPTTSSIIFSALLMLFVSFTLGYALARSLSFDWRYSIIAGFLSLTPSYVGLFEAWNHALIAYELLWLGIIRFYRYAERYLFALCAFLGASMIILSSIYQLYLYAILNAAFFIVFYLAVQAKQEKKKILVAFLAVACVFLSAALVWNASLSQHLSYLKDSNKVNLQLPFTELIRRKGYALDPLGWAGSEMVIAHRAVFHRILSAPVFRHVQAFQSGDWLLATFVCRTRVPLERERIVSGVCGFGFILVSLFHRAAAIFAYHDGRGPIQERNINPRLVSVFFIRRVCRAICAARYRARIGKPIEAYQSRPLVVSRVCTLYFARVVHSRFFQVSGV